MAAAANRTSAGAELAGAVDSADSDARPASAGIAGAHSTTSAGARSYVVLPSTATAVSSASPLMPPPALPLSPYGMRASGPTRTPALPRSFGARQAPEGN